jgi:hypothetical protein
MEVARAVFGPPRRKKAPRAYSGSGRDVGPERIVRALFGAAAIRKTLRFSRRGIDAAVHCIVLRAEPEKA